MLAFCAQAMLGFAPKGDSPDADHNVTPEGQKMKLTELEEGLAKITNELDTELYQDFCAAGDAPPHRKVEPMCTKGRNRNRAGSVRK